MPLKNGFEIPLKHLKFAPKIDLQLHKKQAA